MDSVVRRIFSWYWLFFFCEKREKLIRKKYNNSKNVLKATRKKRSQKCADVKMKISHTYFYKIKDICPFEQTRK
jgi:hypothetical protein